MWAAIISVFVYLNFTLGLQLSICDPHGFEGDSNHTFCFADNFSEVENHTSASFF